MASDGGSRGRVGVLIVLVGVIAAVLAYRRRAFNRYADEFHQRYG